MFISHWFEFSGLDQILAPIDPNDEKANKGGGNGGEYRGTHQSSSHDDDMEVSPFWDIVAPRHPSSKSKSAPIAPTTVSTSATAPVANNQERRDGDDGAIPPPSNDTVTSSANDDDNNRVAFSNNGTGKFVQCQHCHKMTPVYVNNAPTTETAEKTKTTPSNPTTPTDDNDKNSNVKTPDNNNMTTITTPKSSISTTPPFTTIQSQIHAATTTNLDEENSISSNINTNTNTKAMITEKEEEEDPSENEQINLQQAVLRAARETALTSSGPTFVWENKLALFSLCSALPKQLPKKNKKGKSAASVSPKLGSDGKPIPSKNIKKLSKMLGNKPYLVGARSANMHSLGLPDGFTVLHAACHAGNGEVVDYLLCHHVLATTTSSTTSGSGGSGSGGDNHDIGANVVLLDLSERDLQGRTALHIAADRGHIEVIQLLRGAYDALEERAKKLLLEEDSSDSDDDDSDDDEEEELVAEMAKLSTSEVNQIKTQSKATSTPKTPKSRSPMRRKNRISSRSPKPPSSSRKSPMRSPKRSPLKSPLLRSPAFSGSNAPIDLSGRTPLGYAATSPVPKAKKHRGELEKMLYEPGDRSITGVGGGERTPPKARCGPRGRHYGNLLSPNVVRAGGGGGGGRGVSVGGSGRKVAFENHGHSRGFSSDGVGGMMMTEGAESYLSPTPQKRNPRYSTPASTASSSSKFCTPFQSPQPTIHEEEADGSEETMVVCGNGVGVGGLGERENVLQLQWGASEMNGWRIDMEDKILVKYELYGEGESVPPGPATGSSEVATVGPGDVASGAAASTKMIPTMGLFGVFDGHGDGGFASDFIATNLERKLKSNPEWAAAYHSCNDASHGPLESVLTQTYHDLDEDLRKDVTKPRDGGTTAIVALVSDAYLFVANVGDSRCILVRKRKAVTNSDASANDDEGPRNQPSTALLEVVPMSEDHKPDLPGECARIESAGLTVQTDRVPPDENDPDGEFTVVHRVRKSDRELLGVARAFGDYDYKSNAELSASRQAVVCTPDVEVRERDDEEDMYLVLACDGVWDVMSNDEVGAFVARQVAISLGWVGDGDDATNDDGNGIENDKESKSSFDTSRNGAANKNSVQGEVLARVGDDLLAECLRKGSRDNMSVLIVALPASGLLAGGNGAITSSLRTALPANKEEELPKPVATVDDTVRALAYE